MSKIKLYRIHQRKADEVPGSAVELEKSLQIIIENNLDSLLGVRFLASEYSTGREHGGRIDTLGIDENGCPVIIEYKKAINENVINQGLFYLDWLLDHKAEFKLLVMEKLGQAEASGIDWAVPRLVCIASDFTKYDERAVKQINRNIDLIRYRRFGEDLFSLDLAWKTTADAQLAAVDKGRGSSVKRFSDKPVVKAIEELDQPMRDLWESLQSFLFALGDDVSVRKLKLYLAYTRIKTFACIVAQKKQLVVYLHLDPDSIVLKEGFTRDVRKIGHWATGNLEVTIANREQLEKAEPLIVRSYEGA